MLNYFEYISKVNLFLIIVGYFSLFLSLSQNIE